MLVFKLWESIYAQWWCLCSVMAFELKLGMAMSRHLPDHSAQTMFFLKSISIYLFLFVLLHVPNSASLIVYESRNLLNIGKNTAHVISDTFKSNLSWPNEILHSSGNNNGGNACLRRITEEHHHPKQAETVHQAPLPSILLDNVQSLEIRLDDLGSRVTLQWDTRFRGQFPHSSV